MNHYSKRVQLISFSLPCKSFLQLVHGLWSHRAGISNPHYCCRSLPFSILINALLFFVTEHKTEVMKNSSLLKGCSIFSVFSLPEPALISVSEECLMVACRLTLAFCSFLLSPRKYHAAYLKNK